VVDIRECFDLQGNSKETEIRERRARSDLDLEVVCIGAQQARGSSGRSFVCVEQLSSHSSDGTSAVTSGSSLMAISTTVDVVPATFNDERQYFHNFELYHLCCATLHVYMIR
jgi:hypothetical protein